MKLENPYLEPIFSKRIKDLPSDEQRRLLDPDPFGLTLVQRHALPVVRWLIWGQVASGRTELLAHVYIQEAIKSGRTIALHDHFEFAGGDVLRGSNTMMVRVERILQLHYPNVDYKLSAIPDPWLRVMGFKKKSRKRGSKPTAVASSKPDSATLVEALQNNESGIQPHQVKTVLGLLDRSRNPPRT